jgi:hypothetical protein
LAKSSGYTGDRKVTVRVIRFRTLNLKIVLVEVYYNDVGQHRAAWYKGRHSERGMIEELTSALIWSTFGGPGAPPIQLYYINIGQHTSQLSHWTRHNHIWEAACAFTHISWGRSDLNFRDKDLQQHHCTNISFFNMTFDNNITTYSTLTNPCHPRTPDLVPVSVDANRVMLLEQFTYVQCRGQLPGKIPPLSP